MEDQQEIKNQDELEQIKYQTQIQNFELQNESNRNSNSQNGNYENQFQDHNNLQTEDTFLESHLVEMGSKQKKIKNHQLDLLEYAACKSKRTLKESQVLSPKNQTNVYERLYNENFILQGKQDKKQKLYNDQLKEHAKQSKIIKSTNQVLTSKLEKQIAVSINDIVGEDQNMSFEQLGRLMTVLDIFRVIFYDENCEFTNSELFDDQSQMDNKRKFQEMVLHEQLWQLLSGKQGDEQDEEISQVPVKSTFCIVRILLDHNKLSDELRGSLIQEVLSNELQNQNSQSLEEIIKFVKYWNELNIDAISYKKIGYLKPNKFEEYMQQKSQTLTFKPKINEVNYLLEQNNTAKFLKKNPIEGVSQELYQGVNNDQENDLYPQLLSGQLGSGRLNRSSQMQSPQRTMDRVKILYKKQELRDKQIEEKQKEKFQSDFKECTFKPDVTINKKVNEWSVISKYGQSGIFQRLYTLEPHIKKEMMFQQNLIQKQQDDLDQCTFTPSIQETKSLYDRDIYHQKQGKNLIRGYEKQVGRLRYGNQQKQILQQKLNHIPVGENLEKQKSKPVQVPSMLNRPKIQRRVPFYTIDVSMRAGKTGRIAVYEGDDPYTVTNNFAKSFQITGENKQELFLRVKTQIDKHNAEKMLQKMEMNGENPQEYIQKLENLQNQQQEQNLIQYQQQQFQNQNYSQNFKNFNNENNGNVDDQKEIQYYQQKLIQEQLQPENSNNDLNEIQNQNLNQQNNDENNNISMREQQEDDYVEENKQNQEQFQQEQQFQNQDQQNKLLMQQQEQIRQLQQQLLLQQQQNNIQQQ
ncbi:hypothetical protein PPERSA_09108 [Pseudocohnilembus persalinus]|uniref:Uncharacterized protein n=1 Tax=Pseudocohnilembus persalinus TaxID=266149 RepID=A0A0V0QWU1_PSEPJ|nr:hypothetical protein PPERSA_09108 [Pseudocohnilembus persalinus]|eukprot:KRX06706.1 hypothetical protein PPERSA_09108 [Pseudocohnilembus persalinus]